MRSAFYVLLNLIKNFYLYIINFYEFIISFEYNRQKIFIKKIKIKVINNPNAEKNCSCKASFSPKDSLLQE